MLTLTPRSPGAHAVRCQVLAKSGQPHATIAECEAAIELAADDPLNRSQWQQVHQFEEVEKFIKNTRTANNLPNS